MIQLRVKKGSYKLIKSEENFIEAIQLCRILSTIQYNKVIYTKLSETKDFDTSIQLYLVINHAAILYEGIKKFTSIREKLKDLKSYKKNIDKIEKLLNGEKGFIEGVIYNVRKKVAFHFDKHIIAKTLEKFIIDCQSEDKEIIFIKGKSELVKDMRFLLADNLNLHYVLSLIKGKNFSSENKLKNLVEKLLELSELFCGFLQDIIPEMVEDYCELKEQ